MQAPGINVTAIRLGGDAVSTYNWEQNVDISYDGSCGGSYNSNENNTFLPYVTGQPTTAFSQPAGAVLKMYSDAAGINAYPLAQLTAMQYVAADANGCLGAACGMGTTGGRMLHAIIQKPTPLSLTPDLTDTSVYVDEELNYLRAQAGAPTGAHGYCLENEPGIWNSTHPCVHPIRTTCGEVLTKNIGLAQRIRALDANADIFGPGMYGFTEYAQLNYDNAVTYPTDWNTYNLSDTTYNPATYNYMTWVCSYLRQMRNAGNSSNQRLLDVLDLHFYNSGTDATQDSRSFWDSSYVEDSYITQDILGGASINLAPVLNRAIADWYPGTKLGFTEWGLLDNTDAASGIYTADMLGAFGRNNIYLANYFGVLDGFTAGAFKIYRNYDGANSAYGNTGVLANSTDNSKVTAYASITGSNDSTLHLVLINRTTTAQTATVAATASSFYNTGSAWVMDGSGTGTVAAATSVTTNGVNPFTYTLQPHSVYHLVLHRNSTAVATVTAPQPIKIYPNPATSILHIELPGTGNATTSQIAIYDVAGRLLLDKTMDAATLKAGLPLTGIAPGTYLLTINGTRQLFEKL